MTTTTTPISQRFEEWLDLNENECWPPTLESFQRFIEHEDDFADAGELCLLSVAAVAAAWNEYSKHGFSVVSVDGTVSRC